MSDKSEYPLFPDDKKCNKDDASICKTGAVYIKEDPKLKAERY